MFKIAIYPVLFCLIFSACYLINTDSSMSDNWVGPYLSAAANLTLGGEFLVDVPEVISFKELSFDEKELYSFHSSEEAEYYNHNPIGWVYLIFAAKKLFPWASDLKAIELSHFFVHAIVTVGVLVLFKSILYKAIFLFGYGLNPIVLYYTGFPFYYFWQMWASVGVLTLLAFHQGFFSMQGLKWVKYLLIPYAIMLALVFVARPTTLGLVLVFFLLLFFFRFFKVWIPVLSILAFCMTIAFVSQPNEKNFWHSVYVGIGAYPNDTVIGLSDDTGYALYGRETGQTLNASIGGNYYESETIQEYIDISREASISYFSENPLIFLRNAVLNTLQGFTIGYLTEKPFVLHLAMAILGLAFILCLLMSKQYILFFAVCLSLGTFVPYFPPIPAYMYATYMLLVYGLIVFIDWFLSLERVNGWCERKPIIGRLVEGHQRVLSRE